MKGKIWGQFPEKSKGVTLVETLVYLAVFSIFVTTAIEFMLAVNEHNRKAILKNDIQKDMVFISEHLEESINIADSLDVVNSTLEADPSVLRVNANGGYFEYSLENGNIKFDEDGIETVINNTKYKMDRFYVAEILSPRDLSMGVRVELELSSRKNPDITTDFETSYLFK